MDVGCSIKDIQCIFCINFSIIVLTELNDLIDPYNLTLNSMKDYERKEWAHKVINQLKEKKIDFTEKTIFLVGENYRKYLIPYFSNYEIPIEGLPIGKQLSFYKSKLIESSDIQKNILW